MSYNLTGSGKHVLKVLLSTADVEELIGALQKDATAKAKLYRIAQALAGRRALDPDDLLQEALQRALAGSRRCPQGIDIVPFLVETMRSIAAQWLRSARDGTTELVDETIEDISQHSAEDVIILEELETEIFRLFEGEPELLNVLEGMRAGMRGKDLAFWSGLDTDALGYARKIIRKRIIGFLKKGSAA
jgi:hypothetical protein